jgi:hypothetical protein
MCPSGEWEGDIAFIRCLGLEIGKTDGKRKNSMRSL